MHAACILYSTVRFVSSSNGRYRHIYARWLLGAVRMNKIYRWHASTCTHHRIAYRYRHGTSGLITTGRAKHTILGTCYYYLLDSYLEGRMAAQP